MPFLLIKYEMNRDIGNSYFDLILVLQFFQVPKYCEESFLHFDNWNIVCVNYSILLYVVSHAVP